MEQTQNIQSDAVEHFKKFSASVDELSELIRNISARISPKHTTPYEAFLFDKISEVLVTIIQTGSNRPDQWRSLLTYVNMGYLLASEIEPVTEKVDVGYDQQERIVPITE